MVTTEVQASGSCPTTWTVTLGGRDSATITSALSTFRSPWIDLGAGLEGAAGGAAPHAVKPNASPVRTKFFITTSLRIYAVECTAVSNRARSILAPALQRLGHRHLVRPLQVGAHRHAHRDPGDLDSLRLEEPRQV